MTDTYDLVIHAASAVVGGAEVGCTVGVRDGTIVAVEPYGADLAGQQELRLADDEVLLPGLVDTHVHVNDPGRTEWEGFVSATRAAAAGGVTTIIDMPLNSLPPTVDVAALDVKRKAAQDNCFIDVGFWGGAIPGNVSDLRPLHDEGVFGFKCFLADSGVEEFPQLESDRVRRGAARGGDLRRADDRARRGRPRPGACTRRVRPRVRRLPRVPAAGCGEPGHRGGHRGRSLDRLPAAHPAPVVGRCACR